MTFAPPAESVTADIATRQPYPWVVPDLFRWFGLLLLAAAGICVAWWGASGSAGLGHLLTWVNVGVVAVIVGGLGNVTWVLQGRRAVTARQRELLAACRSALSADVVPEPYPDEQRVAVPGTSRHHRPGCAAVADKAVERLPLVAHERAGRRACGLCDG